MVDIIGALKRRKKFGEWIIKSKRNFYITFSQCGEDMFLRSTFFHQEHGTYVDIGAHHPFKYSNTFILCGYEIMAWFTPTVVFKRGE